MFDYLTEEKMFLAKLKKQFEDLPEAKKIDTFLYSKFVHDEEIIPAVFIEHEKIDDRAFFKSIAKSVFDRFKLRFFTFVNKVFFEILGSEYSLDELTDSETIKKLNREFKDIIDEDPLFEDFFNDIVPRFLTFQKSIKFDCPDKLAQMVRHCDHFDSILSDAENKELEDRIEWIYELPSLFFDVVQEIDTSFEVELNNEDIVFYELANSISNYGKLSLNQNSWMSNIIISEDGNELIVSDIIQVENDVCCGQAVPKPVFVKRKLINEKAVNRKKKIAAKKVGGLNNVQKEASDTSDTAA